MLIFIIKRRPIYFITLITLVQKCFLEKLIENVLLMGAHIIIQIKRNPTKRRTG